ncbi:MULTISPECIES: TIGR03751 family conjugal transfer lipoprotein [Yersiniaceae]|jgi:conjugative transfer region lipoprotein (TIGR03751 family)|uniref:TIGR03751 family conjugal transfer lipoprotein n=1 Tax=Yersiniaceae TaxID=1903411 RepID=UPI001A1876B4|nr:TIGR03751 family conjugal transfer lipoprotein [Serratia liquefaciens]EKN4905989.1 TIGR03751 family conjugal transfer lipoprotein [Yersinia enterocolitica]HAT3729534.1 TIGR03751 family conjugal transfer lipoprotein [Serratia marcescens]HDM8374054.1 TIGR03751 family conjugal transfer lipoprotein [Yersinia enterocolitica]HEN3244250.1 TIGR03751 family conjugal transfer lipoprotein [Yersinia enterocolitica]HEN3450963.1 TIGR03751 family conjugal transfer lipoprotein [Yersinia enterocolitica]
MKQRVLPLLCLAVLLTGCSTTKDEMLPPGDSTMLELWQNKGSSARTTTEARSTLRRGLTDDDSAARQAIEDSYTRTAENEIQQVFPRLPNPDMVIYIYPHMAGNAPAPVPGYSSVFPFYSRVQYALPGERTEAL